MISAHIVGMYGLALVVGDLIDRFGRRLALVGGLVVMAGSTLVLAWIESVIGMSVALFGLGLGWVFSCVAATSELVDLAALAERGRLVGFSDLASGLAGAALALVGGAAYSHLGAEAIAHGATAAVALPALLITAARLRPATRVLESAGWSPGPARPFLPRLRRWCRRRRPCPTPARRQQCEEDGVCARRDPGPARSAGFASHAG